jgi:hypothetical protein
MPSSPPGACASLALVLAASGWAAAGEPPPRSAPLLDHREVKLFRREIADDLKDLERLRARLERLDALRAARRLDVRALDALDARVHQEMVAEAREKRLEARPRLGEAARRSAAGPVAPGGVTRFFTAADEARVDQITVEWSALRGRAGRADLEARRALLAELLTLTRVELEDDLRAFREKGGDVSSLPGLERRDPGGSP